MKHLLPGIAVVLILSPIAVLGAPQGKPGLWNITSTMEMANMPQIPPETLAMMKARGMKIPGMGGQPTTTQICMTPQNSGSDMMSGAQGRLAQRDVNCTPRILNQTASSATTEIVCHGKMEGTGRSQISWRGNNHYEGSYNFKGSMRGQPQNISTRYTGDWVKADCGAVKPFSAMTKPR